VCVTSEMMYASRIGHPFIGLSLRVLLASLEAIANKLSTGRVNHAISQVLTTIDSKLSNSHVSRRKVYHLTMR
jgi:hypothetical protein